MKYNRKKEDVCKVEKIEVIFFCGYTEKTYKAESYDFLSSESECETCGSHGSITIDVRCECGRLHELKLKEW